MPNDTLQDEWAELRRRGGSPAKDGVFAIAVLVMLGLGGVLIAFVWPVLNAFGFLGVCFGSFAILGSMFKLAEWLDPNMRYTDPAMYRKKQTYIAVKKENRQRLKRVLKGDTYRQGKVFRDNKGNVVEVVHVRPDDR